MSAPSSDEEHIQDLRKDLGKLITDGLVPYNVGENGGCLLKLGMVVAEQGDVDADAEEGERYEAATKALRAILEVAVEHKDMSGKQRRLLRAVLPLTPQLVGLPIRDRRTVAGKDLKPDKKDDVRPGTIRNHYEPKALDKLAVVLWQMEQEFQAGIELRLPVETTSAQQGAEPDSKGSDS
jgi:hypothetical protein